MTHTPDLTEELATKYFLEMKSAGKRWQSSRIFTLDEIPEKKLSGAIQSYAPVDIKHEKILLLIDETVMGSGKAGLLLTANKLYYSLRPKSGAKHQSGVFDVSELSRVGFSANGIFNDLYINTSKIGLFSQIKNSDVSLLKNFFSALISQDTDFGFQAESEKNAPSQVAIDPGYENACPSQGFSRESSEGHAYSNDPIGGKNSSSLVPGFEANELIIFGLSWLLAVMVYFGELGFLKGIAGLLMFTVIAPIAIKIANILRKIAHPDAFISSGMIHTLKIQLFWSIGPQCIAAIISWLIPLQVFR